MTEVEALQLLVEAIDAHAAKSAGGLFVKLDWIADALADARAVLAVERDGSDVRRSAIALYEFAMGPISVPFDALPPGVQDCWDDRPRVIVDARLAAVA